MKKMIGEKIYVSSCRTIAEKMATITVHRGLNIEENREPLIEITQA
jgi:hypothetical protein